MKRLLSALSIVLTYSLLMPTYSYAAKNPYGTSTVDPAAPNQVILTLRDGSKRAEFAYERLIKMKTSTLSIYEPFLKRREKFTVIPLKSLFAFVGIEGSDRVVTKALNDYIFTATAQDFIRAQGYLAIKRNGQPIQYDQGGPIRIIFPDTSRWAKKLDAWNWSITSMSVKN